MDLIYADDTRQDIGIMYSYDLDMAYGYDENSFTCSIARQDHCCDEGYFLYVEGEEYGGIVDGIAVNTEEDSVTYSGRTWHGILQGKVICPDPEDDYLLLDGEANSILQDIIDRVGLSDLFEASTDNSGISIDDYQMPRYVYAYTGIKDMLKEYHAKLMIRWNDGMITLSAEPSYDYSQDEEFDTAQVDFEIKKNFRPVNHIICLGQGDLGERAVIHIFTDENGGIQQYVKTGVDEPLQNSDYIEDTSKQVMTGKDEVTEVYDVSNAEITKNYVLLTSKPADWATNCEDYFYYEPKLDENDEDEGGTYKEAAMEAVKYKKLKAKPSDWSTDYSSYYTYNPNTDKYSQVNGVSTYSLLASKPGDWAKNYESYYTSNHSAVSGVTTTKYTKLKKKPKDWKKKYGDYYILFNDGVTSEYRSVDGISYNVYKIQTHKPTDWSSNYSSYYRKATAKELKEAKNTHWYSVQKTKKNKVPAWKKKKYYTQFNREKAPAFSGSAKYRKIEETKAPTWQANTYYYKIDESAPTWQANTYYEATDDKKAPAWRANTYYRQVLDYYAVMVAGAIEKLTEYHESDDLGINLAETDQVYDVGDIVGTIEQVTGLEAIQEVVKKVVKIQNDDISINYEVK